MSATIRDGPVRLSPKASTRPRRAGRLPVRPAAVHRDAAGPRPGSARRAPAEAVTPRPHRIPRSIRRSGPRPVRAAITSAGRDRSAGCPAWRTWWRSSRRCRGRPCAARSTSGTGVPTIAPASRSRNSHSGGPVRVGREHRLGPFHARGNGIHPVQVVGVRPFQRRQPGQDDMGVPGGLVEPVVHRDHRVEVRQSRVSRPAPVPRSPDCPRP